MMYGQTADCRLHLGVNSTLVSLNGAQVSLHSAQVSLHCIKVSYIALTEMEIQ